MIRLRKRILYITAILVAVLMALGVGLLITPAKSAAAAVTTGGRVKMEDLFKRYPIDAVIGPVDVVDIYPKNADGTTGDGKIDRNDLDETGRFTYIEDDEHKDINGNYTNNIYGIPANRYFDVESYIYATGTKNSPAGRKLYGWNPAIQGVHPDGEGDIDHPIGANNGTIAENGEKMTGGYLTTSASPIGIYVRYNGAQFFGTTFKYALIVPEDITSVEEGSAAFVGYDSDNKLRSYYGDKNYPNDSTESGYDREYAAEYTDFACFYNGGTNPLASAPYFWQPRERLAGVFFPEGSRLKEIVGSTDAGISGEDSSNQTRTNDLGKSAFLGCDNLRFMILPDATTNTSGVTTIGKGAFYKCALLADTNIPNSVTSIGSKAYANCRSLLHISLPTDNNLGTISSDVFSGCDKIRHVDNKGKYGGTFTTNDSTLFVMGNKPENGVNDTGAFVFELTSGGKLSALSLAGETGENSDKLFVFPSAEHFIDGDRRKGVTYDYLNCNGQRVKNTLSDLKVKNSSGNLVGLDKVEEYDIAESFAQDVWCQNVILPKEVKKIGDNAFNKSHIKYLETYATTINTKAFNDDNTNNKNQWFYFHQIKTGNSFTKYNIASDAFVGAASNVNERHIVLENKELYTFATSTNTNNGNFRANVINKMSVTTANNCKQYVQYMIPVIAHINNEDSQAVTIDQSNMMELFYNDSDYVGNVSVSKGNDKTITYTKRLSNSTSLTHTDSGTRYDSKSQNYAYNVVKQRTGEWSSDPTAASKNTNPVLSNMKSTKWFTDATCASETNAEQAHVGSATSTDIYTKNIARPENIANGKYDGKYKGQYTYGDKYTFGTTEITLGNNDTTSLNYYDVLGLPNADYSIVLESFTYPGASSSDNSKPTELLNAGTYKFKIQLNSKWGEWSDSYIEANSDYTTASVKVERKKIDVSSLSYFPEFVSADPVNGTYYALHGANTPIYSYNDGWYAAQQNDQILNDTRTVTNSYVYYSGNPITIMLRGEVVNNEDGTSTLGDYVINSRNGLTFPNSSRYTASFAFTLKNVAGTSNQYNYYYYYGDDADTKYENVTDSVAGLSMTTKQDFSFRLTKIWYIVMESNWFIVSNSGSNEPYSPLDNPTVTYGDKIEAKVPALYKTNVNSADKAKEIEFEILYTPIGERSVTLTGNATNSKLVLGDGVKSIGHYINSSMPAGEYTLKLYGSKVVDKDGKESKPITGEYTITVLPREFDADNTTDNTNYIQTLHNAMGKNGAGNAYPLDRNKALHDSITEELGKLNGSLKLPAEGNYWSDNSSYYSNAVTVTYNWEGSGETGYSNYQSVLNNLDTAGKYTIYYCISAKNYVTVGGEGASDRTDCSFVTTLYTEMRFDDIYAHIVTVGDPNFSDVVYNGSDVYTSVPASQYYKAEFKDVDADGNPNYINARAKASVTLTLYDPDLARWNATIVDESKFTAEQLSNAHNYYELSADKKSLKVFFDILPAENKWLSAPQVPGWSYKGFDESVYTITGTLQYTNAKVYYRIGTLNADGKTYNWIDMDGTLKIDGVTHGEYFEVDENGVITNTTVIAKLNDLPVQTYYLGSYVCATTDGNVQALDTTTYNSTIVLTKAANTWTTSPNIIPWTWNEYKSEVNKISAVPYFNESTANKIVYTILYSDKTPVLYSDKTPVTTLTAFTEVTSNVADALKALDAGSYYIRASLKGTDNYNDIGNTDVSFTIGLAQNSWTTAPRMTTWQYKQFTRETNFVAGVPNYGTKVTYAIYDSDPAGTNKPTATKTFNAIGDEGVEAYLKGLEKGNYWLVASVEGVTDQYGLLSVTISFSVIKATNSWKEQPAITGWVYGSFTDASAASYLTKGVAVSDENGADVRYTVRKTSETGAIVEGCGNLTYTALINALKTLSVNAVSGSSTVDGYYLCVTTVEAVNYGVAPERNIYFTISRAQNSWETEPSIASSWQYGSTPSTPVTGVLNNTEGGTLTVTTEFYTAIEVNGKMTYTGNPLQLSGDLRAAVGTYARVTKAPAGINYNAIEHVSYFEITKKTISWATNKAPSDIDAVGKVTSFTKPELAVAAYNDLIRYTIKQYGSNSTIDCTNANIEATIKGDATIKGLSSGTYTVTVTVGGDGYGTDTLALASEYNAIYEPFTYSFVINITLAQLEFSTHLSVTGWTYGATTQTKVAAVVDIAGNYTPEQKTALKTALEISDELITYTITKGSSVVGEGNDLGKLLEGLAPGTYSATATVETKTGMYIGVSESVAFTVSKATRDWDTGSYSSATADWEYNEIDKIAKIKFSYTVPTGDSATLTISVDGDQVNSSATQTLQQALQARLQGLGYGTHTVTATVSESDYYSQLTKTVTITVSRATNKWYDDGEIHRMTLASSWTWNTSGYNKDKNNFLDWSYPIPANGTTVDITIEKAGTVVYFTTLSYEIYDVNKVRLLGDDSGITSQLLSLDAGSYSIKAVIPQSDSYKELSQTITFTVAQADNAWKTLDTENDLPFIKGESNGIIRIVMEPVYGDASKIVFQYRRVDDDGKVVGEWTNVLPTSAGTYQFTASLAGSTNYKAISTYSGTFSIDKDSNGWIVVPGVNGWEWDKFDRDENIFRGTAVSNGTVRFSISKVVVDGSRALIVSDFYPVITDTDLIKLNGTIENPGFTLEADGIVVSQEIEAILKKLKPGNYKVTATASGGSDFQSLSTSNNFTVYKVANEWGLPAGSPEGANIDVYPSVNSFVFDTTGTLNKGSTIYGTSYDSENNCYIISKVHYLIYLINPDGTQTYKKTYSDDENEFFKNLEVGNYVLKVWVESGEIYNDLYSQDSPYTTPFSITKAQNSWKENAPQTSMSHYYSDLQRTSIHIFSEPKAQQGTAVYQILRTDFSPAAVDESGKAKVFSYSELLGGIKDLPSGDYIIRITIAGTLTNYEANLTADIALSILSYKTEFRNLPKKLGGQWQEGNTTLDKLDNEIFAVYGEIDSIIPDTAARTNILYTFGTDVVEGTWSELAEAVKSLSAGSYQIVVTAKHPDNVSICETVSVTLQLDIRQGTNEWLNNWNISNSLGSASRDNVGSQWTWGSAINWTNAKPKYGNIVYVEIRKDGASEALSYITVDYDADDEGGSAIKSVGTAISALDAGEYKFIVTSPAATNWKELTSDTTFRISPAGNEWTEVPNILVSVNNEWKNASYIEGTTDRRWTYNTAALPEATALHGTVTYTYYVQGSTVALSGIPANAGKYKVVFNVAAPKSGNYAGLSKEINFEIVKGTDTSFIVSPGVTGWAWEEYDRTVNLFTGIPTTLGKVSFAVLQDGKVVAVNGTKLEDIQLVNDKGEHTGNPDKDVYVTKEISELLNKLNAGSYRLRIDVAEVDNYNGFPTETPFVVSPATNVWTTTPRIVSWSLGKWVAKDNLPKAEARDGEVNIVISSQVEGDAVIYYSSIYNEETGERTVVNNLATAPAGWYVMKATVVAVSSNFTAINPEDYPFQVFVTGSNDVINSWITDAAISSWTASKNSEDINMPEASPLRGLTWFEFTDRISGKKLTENDEVFIIEAGTTYFQDFYIPMAPGKYSMTAYAARRDADGKIFDRIYSESVPFEIFYRENAWENEPRIASILYLGEKAEWEGPTATAVEAGSKITYSYRDAETGLPIGSAIPMVNGIPAKAGKYLLTATATAEYCWELVSPDVEFTVDYSYNGWISGVRIENWSEEYEPNDPTAEALFGTDKIVYKYATQEAPDEFLPDKPTEEGNYIVYAIIDCEKDGYENISDSFYFTIEPAFDIDLLIVDIVLGTVGCAMAAGVIYLALRKRKRM